MEKNVFFDALGINIKLDDDNYSQCVRDLLTDFNYYVGFPPTQERRTHRNYECCIIWECDDFKIFFNYSGFGKNMGAFIEVKGFIGCNTLVNFLISHGWRWSLTRSDISIDFSNGKKGFHNLQCDLMDYAKQKNIDSIQTVGDWLYEKKGRTLYVGAKSSNTQIRLYEKSKEQYEKGNLNYPANVNRLEVQFRPTSIQKKHINVLTPLSVLSFNRNLVDLFNKYFSSSISPTPVSTQHHLKSSKDSLDYAIDLYKNKVLDFIDEVGYYQATRYFLKKIKTLYLLKKGK